MSIANSIRQGLDDLQRNLLVFRSQRQKVSTLLNRRSGQIIRMHL